MKEFHDKVAVVTGAASGIGLAMAEKFANEGMKVVLADIEMKTLTSAVELLQAQGADVLPVQTDVSNYQSVWELSQKTLDTFGSVHILCNNAGVIDMTDRPIWETPLDSLEWLMGVNVWGVLYGIHVFVPIMLKQSPKAGHIVNTASIAGLLSGGDYGLYNATKHAVVSISETIHHSLEAQGANIKVSVLCPGFVHTRFVSAERNQPSNLTQRSKVEEIRAKERKEMMQNVLRDGMSPKDAAQFILDAIQEEKLYVLSHPEFTPAVRERFENILANG